MSSNDEAQSGSKEPVDVSAGQAEVNSEQHVNEASEIGQNVEATADKEEEVKSTAASADSPSGDLKAEYVQVFSTEQTSRDEDTDSAVPTISAGPYKLVSLIKSIPVESQEFSESKGAKITCMEAWDLNIYVGTDAGELIHMYRLDDELGYIQVSRQRFSEKRVRPIRKLVLLPEMSKLLVLCGKTMSAYTLPELSPANIGKLRDVHDLSVDCDTVHLDSKGKNYTTDIGHINGDVFVGVTVFTSKFIRLIRVFDDGIRLFKDVNYVGSLAGVQRSSLAAVAANGSYDLVDVSKSQKVPLFPTSAGEESPPVVLPAGKKEFLMICGGSSADLPSVGMIVNSTGDISRGTITWESYPVSVTVDYPYVVAVLKSGKVCVNSLHSQKEVQTIDYSATSVTHLGVRSVGRVFEFRDKELSKALTKRVIVSEMTPDDLEKIAIESDRAQMHLSRSSCLIYDSDGTFVKMFQRYPRPLRWLDLYKACTAVSFDSTFDELMDELEQETAGADTSEGFLIVTMLLLLSLKFYNFDRAFDVITNNMQHFDPRLVVYIIDSSQYSHIFGSVWMFDGLIGFVEELKKQYESLDDGSKVSEFMKLYMNVCLASSQIFSDAEREPILKTIEIYLLNLALDEGDDLANTVRHSHREATEILLLRKRYFWLSKLYAALGNYEQCLYYWKGLIEGELKDPTFVPEVDKSLAGLVECLLENCSDKEAVVTKYAMWLLEKYPESGLKLVTDSRVRGVEFNELKILTVLTTAQSPGSGLNVTYLEYVLGVQKKPQFMGTLVLTILDELLSQLEDNAKLAEQLKSCVSNYGTFRIPRPVYCKYWKMEAPKIAAPYFLLMHDKLYGYLASVKSDSVSILSQLPVVSTCVEKIIGTPYEDLLPLIAQMIRLKQKDYQAVVSKLGDLGDYKTAERYASTLQLPDMEEKKQLTAEEKEASQDLLIKVFDMYLELDNGELIDSFLSSHNLLADDTLGETSIFEKMSKFTTVLGRIPDNFPLARLHNFLERSLAEFDNHNEDMILSKNLYRSRNMRMKKLKGCLHDGASDV